MLKIVISRFLVGFFLFCSTEKLGRETFRAVFQKTSGSEKSGDKRGVSIKIFR